MYPGALWTIYQRKALSRNMPKELHALWCSRLWTDYGLWSYTVIYVQVQHISSLLVGLHLWGKYFSSRRRLHIWACHDEGRRCVSKFTFSNARNNGCLIVLWWIIVGAHLFCYYSVFTEFSLLLFLNWSVSWMWFLLYLMPQRVQSWNSSIRPSTSMFGPSIFMKKIPQG